MVLSDTLIIKHLPNVLSDEQKESLLQHFGAKEVKCISSKHNKYNIAFARFESEKVAEDILHRLHQADVLGSSLAVEFAQRNQLKSTLPEQKLDFSYNCTKGAKECENCYKQFIEKLSSWHTGVNFKQPVPSHLKYHYPPPNKQTLVNIIKALATVPKFYTQVLHLMNKMNLPCPFEKDILPEFVIEIGPSKNTEGSDCNTQEEPEKCEEVIETSESEISTDEEIKNENKTVPVENKVKKKSKMKVPKFVKPVPATSQKPKKDRKMTFEEIFEKVTDEKEHKKIKLSHSFSLSEEVTKQTEELIEKPESSGGFGYIHPVKKAAELKSPEHKRDEREEERLETEEIICISEAELTENRIPEKDRSILPVFKNYAEGAPTCRLYLKNVAKTATQEDLRYIYHRYLPKLTGSEPNMFDIRLMQEGRMKGQAFVTLQTVELAQKALKETNGYILKGRPLVVQFARSATK